MKKNKKKKIAILSLTSCEGCQFAFMDYHKNFLEIAGKVDIVEMRLVKENNTDKNKDILDLSYLNKIKHFDVAFVEGSPITKENFETLKMVRKKTDILIAMGSCAAIGGIYHLKNYYDKDKILKSIYKHTKHINNVDILPIDEIVDVDFYLPGCPITGVEFYKFLNNILQGKNPHITQRPVCYECQTNGYECVLLKGEPCLGPITLGGCNAVCLKSKMPCYGCRGLRAVPEIDQLMEKLKLHHKGKRIEQILEMFGVKDKIQEYKDKK